MTTTDTARPAEAVACFIPDDDAPSAGGDAEHEYRRLLHAADLFLDAIIGACSEVGRGSWAEPLNMALAEVEFTVSDFVADVVAVAPGLVGEVPHYVADAEFSGRPVAALVPKRLTRSERLARIADRMGVILLRDLPPAASVRVPPGWLDDR